MSIADGLPRPAETASARPAAAAPSLQIRLDDLGGPEIHALLQEHLEEMARHSPPESVHALDLTALKGAAVSFWTAWSDGRLVGCAALKALDGRQGEVKSMRTPSGLRRRGVGRALLLHIIDEARRRGYTDLWLETGSMPAFSPARTLYQSAGFALCPPFADYVDDPNSVFMHLHP
jgi:putative acetyltransferase